MLKKKQITSIIVTYNPNLDFLSNVIKSHLYNFSRIVIVNNSSDVSVSLFQSKKITYIVNECNIGLASALNVGILEAKKQGAKMVALFDQDTLLPANFSQNMLPTH